MTATRDVGDISTDPAGKSGSEWTEDVRDSILALWALLGGLATNVAGTNAITADAAVSTGLTALSDGMLLILKPVNTNTGAVTLDYQDLGAKAVIDAEGDALDAGDLAAGSLYFLVFLSASDHWRVTGSIGGTTNVTIEGGISLQLSPVARLLATVSSTIALTTVAARSFACTQATSRVLIQGNVTRVAGALGSPGTGSITIHLYVDGVSVGSFPDTVEENTHASSPACFIYSPGDTDSHTYELRAQADVAVTYPAGPSYIVCQEIAPN